MWFIIPLIGIICALMNCFYEHELIFTEERMLFVAKLIISVHVWNNITELMNKISSLINIDGEMV